MRTVFVLSILAALAALAPTPASAQKSLAETQASGCLCHFGYGNVCQTSIACEIEVGRCSGTCTPGPNASSANH
jgi:hypothetical protein